MHFPCVVALKSSKNKKFWYIVLFINDVIKTLRMISYEVFTRIIWTIHEPLPFP